MEDWLRVNSVFECVRYIYTELMISTTTVKYCKLLRTTL